MAAPTPTTPYLELQAVETWLGPRKVFENLSLQFHRGEHTVVLGPNGSGKSSLIKLLSRELYPVVKPGSRLRIFGSTTVNLWELRRRIGMVSPDLQSGYGVASVPPTWCSPASSAPSASAAANSPPQPCASGWQS